MATTGTVKKVLAAAGVVLAYLPGCTTTTTREVGFLFPEAETPPERPALPDPGRSAATGVAISLRVPDDARYGELVDATVAIGNGGIHPVLVREVEIEGQLPDPVAWMASFVGQLRLRGDEAVWLPRGLDRTPPLFASGLLFPGESIEIRRPLRIREPSARVIARFQTIPMKHIGSEVLLPRLPRGKTFEEAGKVMFRAPQLTDTIAFRKHPPGSPERIALVLEPRTWPVETSSATLSVSWADAAMPGALLESLGSGGAEVSHWSGGAAWVLRPPGEGGLLLYGVDGGHDDPLRITGVSFLAFDLADACARENLALLVDDGRGSLRSRRPGEVLEVILGAREQGRVSATVDVVEPHGPDRRMVLVLQ